MTSETPDPLTPSPQPPLANDSLNNALHQGVKAQRGWMRMWNVCIFMSFVLSCHFDVDCWQCLHSRKSRAKNSECTHQFEYMNMNMNQAINQSAVCPCLCVIRVRRPAAT